MSHIKAENLTSTIEEYRARGEDYNIAHVVCPICSEGYAEIGPTPSNQRESNSDIITKEQAVVGEMRSHMADAHLHPTKRWS